MAHLEGKSGPQLYESDGRLGVDHVTPGADWLGQLHVRGGVILTLRLRHVARPAGHARSGQVTAGQRQSEGGGIQRSRDSAAQMRAKSEVIGKDQLGQAEVYMAAQ